MAKKEDDAKYYITNREKLNEKNKRYYYRIRKENPMAIKLRSTRSRARKNGILFDITISDLVVPELCPYLGIPLNTSNIGKQCFDSASIDKIDPSKGYTKGNVEIISYQANVMKNNASPEQLLRFAKVIIERFSK